MSSTHSHDVPARRNFLKLSARLAALGLSSLGLEPARRFFVHDVNAQSRVTDYKALVCLFMFGGADSNNIIVPDTDYAQYGLVRTPASQVGLTQAEILKFTASRQGGKSYGFHPNLAPLKALFDQGQLTALPGVCYPNPN